MHRPSERPARAGVLPQGVEGRIARRLQKAMRCARVPFGHKVEARRVLQQPSPAFVELVAPQAHSTGALAPAHCRQRVEAGAPPAKPVPQLVRSAGGARPAARTFLQRALLARVERPRGPPPHAAGRQPHHTASRSLLLQQPANHNALPPATEEQHARALRRPRSRKARRTRYTIALHHEASPACPEHNRKRARHLAANGVRSEERGTMPKGVGHWRGETIGLPLGLENELCGQGRRASC